MSREAEALALLERWEKVGIPPTLAEARRIVNGKPKRTALRHTFHTKHTSFHGWLLISEMGFEKDFTIHDSVRDAWLAGNDDPEPTAESKKQLTPLQKELVKQLPDATLPGAMAEEGNPMTHHVTGEPDAPKKSLWPVSDDADDAWFADGDIFFGVYEDRRADYIWAREGVVDLTRALCEESSDAERAKRIVRDLEHFGVQVVRNRAATLPFVLKSKGISRILDLAESDDE